MKEGGLSIGAGLILGVAGGSGRWHHGCNSSDRGYGGWMMIDHEVSAMPWQFMGIRNSLFADMGGFSEGFRANGFDIDLALRMTEKAGVRHLCICGAEAVLNSSASGYGLETWNEADLALLWQKWGGVIRRGDPYYNPNMTLYNEGVFFYAV